MSVIDKASADGERRREVASNSDEEGEEGELTEVHRLRLVFGRLEGTVDGSGR